MKKVFLPSGWTHGQIRDLNRRHLHYVSRMIVEIARLTLISKDELQMRVLVEGEEQLQSALRDGRGALLIGTHLGNWWLARTALSSRGYRIANIANRLPIESLELHLQRVRERFDITTTFVGEGGRQLAEQTFERNEFFSVMSDISAPGREDRSVVLSLGHAAINIDLGPALLALESRVPVLWLTIRRVGKRKHRVSIEPMFPSGSNSPPEPGEIVRCWVEKLYAELLSRPEEWWHWDHLILGQAKETSSQ